MYTIVIQPEAEADLDDAYEWYEEHRTGLGDQFLAAIEAAFDQLRKTASVQRIVYKSVRQSLVRRFPYIVSYIIDADVVDVIAVFHAHRDPAEWKSRFDDRE